MYGENYVDDSEDENDNEIDTDDESSADEDVGQSNIQRKMVIIPQKQLESIRQTVKIKFKVNKRQLHMFSIGPLCPKDKDKMTRLVSCHVCENPHVSPKMLHKHTKTRRHWSTLGTKAGIKRITQPVELFYGFRDGRPIYFRIYAGEDIKEVTDEYKDRITDRPNWSFRKVISVKKLKKLNCHPLYDYNIEMPIIGLDYLLQLPNIRTKETCFCVLCDKRLPHPILLEHITGREHEEIYISKHFPRLYQKVLMNLNGHGTNQLCSIFRKLYGKIERKHGLKRMIPVDKKHFRMYKEMYKDWVKQQPHYGEDMFDFSDTEVDDLINECNKKSKTVDSVHVKSQSHLSDEQIRYQLYDDKRSNKIEKWRAYSTTKNRKVEQLKRDYQKYEKDPESHPDYQDEWQLFWKNRSKELRKEHVNPDTYDFEKEWLSGYWQKRMETIFLNEVDALRTHLRSTNHLPVNLRIRTPSPSYQPLIKPRNEYFSAQNKEHRDAAVRMSATKHVENNQVRGEMSSTSRRSQNRSENTSRHARPERCSTISVLRLLVALENQLGSLGPKAVNLLSETILRQKGKEQSDNLLIDDEYYILFATALEKLKGQLIANIIDRFLMGAVERTIDELSTIIKLMDDANKNCETPKVDTVKYSDNVKYERGEEDKNDRGLNMIGDFQKRDASGYNFMSDYGNRNESTYIGYSGYFDNSQDNIKRECFSSNYVQGTSVGVASSDVRGDDKNFHSEIMHGQSAENTEQYTTNYRGENANRQRIDDGIDRRGTRWNASTTSDQQESFRSEGMGKIPERYSTNYRGGNENKDSYSYGNDFRDNRVSNNSDLPSISDEHERNRSEGVRGVSIHNTGRNSSNYRGGTDTWNNFGYEMNRHGNNTAGNEMHRLGNKRTGINWNSTSTSDYFQNDNRESHRSDGYGSKQRKMETSGGSNFETIPGNNWAGGTATNSQQRIAVTDPLSGGRWATFSTNPGNTSTMDNSNASGNRRY